ncbi:MAG: hypothetical protein C4523_19560 [Myxococcales bacterium]|nr:MAG: hypothetical protein C4523_19560 [Myxococcales bacterium]
MPQARRTIEVDSTPEKAFAVLIDYPSYASFIPEVQHVEILEARPHGKRVRFGIAIFGLPVTYTLDLIEEPYRRLSWTLVASNWLKSVEGSWEIEALDRRQVSLAYVQQITIKGLIPKVVSTKLVGFALPELLERFKTRIETLKD